MSSAVGAPRRGLVRSGLVVGASVAAANILNALFHVALARVLVPADYSLLASLLAVVLVLTVPTLAVQAAVAREVAHEVVEGSEARAGSLVRTTLRLVAAAAVATLALGGIVLYPLVRVLGGGLAASYATAGAVAAAVLAPAVWGALQGAQRFVALGASQTLVAALRFAPAVAVAAVGARTAGVLGAAAAGATAAALLSLAPLRGLLAAGAHVASPRRVSFEYAGGAALALSLFTALTTADVVAARAAFTPTVAGRYAAASIGVRTLLLVATAVTTVLFPRVTTLRDPHEERRHLLLGIAAVGGISAAGVAIAWPIAGALLRAVFGTRYDGAAPWVGPFGIAMGLYAVANVYLYHFLSIGRTRVVLVLAPLFAVQLALFGIFHATPLALIGVQIAVAAALVLASELFDRKARA